MGSPKGVWVARAPADRHPLHAKSPAPSLRPPLPKVWGVGEGRGWPVGGQSVGGGEASRPKASLSPGVGCGGIGGQRLHLAKSILGGQSGV